MRKIFLSITAMLLLFSCQNDDKTNQAEAKSSIRACASQEVLERQLQENPELALRMNEIEEFTQNAMLQGRLVNGKIEIPVVVNVLYRTAA